MSRWICSQFGGREKYAIPRALHSSNNLDALYTDIFVRPGSLVSLVASRASTRYHPDLSNARVVNFNGRFFLLRLTEKILKTSYEEDRKYDELVAATLTNSRLNPDVFFGYSYSSRTSMQIAKARGLHTILGQINPGPPEADIVAEEYRRFKNGAYKPFVPDAAYWDRWREEIGYADQVIVNSEWSAKLLQSAGIQGSKLKIIPLAYEENIPSLQREYPERFSRSRPLRLLFLGGLEIRKGIHLLIDAMRSMINLPVTLDLVGVLKSPAALLEDLPANVNYCGAVAASETAKFYAKADLFVFPTLSDGFGLTLLEAQARKLPVLSSTRCARIIADNVNGLTIEAVTPRSIADAIQRVLDEPGMLSRFSVNSVSMDDYSINRLSHRLNQLVK